MSGAGLESQQRRVGGRGRRRSGGLPSRAPSPIAMPVPLHHCVYDAIPAPGGDQGAGARPRRGCFRPAMRWVANRWEQRSVVDSRMGAPADPGPQRVKAIVLAELWRKYKRTGDRPARDQLILAYSPLVKYVAGRLVSRMPAHVEL